MLGIVELEQVHDRNPLRSHFAGPRILQVRKPALKGANFTRHQGAMIMQPQRRKGLMVGSL